MNGANLWHSQVNEAIKYLVGGLSRDIAEVYATMDERRAMKALLKNSEI